MHWHFVRHALTFCTSCIDTYGPVMKHFSALLIHWSSVDSLHKGPVIQGFGVLFDISTNKLSRVAGVIWDALKLICRQDNVERTVTYHKLWPTCQNERMVLFCRYLLWSYLNFLVNFVMDLSILVQVTSTVLRQLYAGPSASEITLKVMGKIVWLNHNET